MLAFLHLSLDIELPSPLVDLCKKAPSGPQTLDGQYYSDEVQKLLSRSVRPPPSFSPFQLHQNRNLQSLRKKVSVLLNHGIDFERSEVVSWIQLCQNRDGGFGFYHGTTSFLENTYFAIDILSKLGGSPREIEGCRQYIQTCQTGIGGFGRAPVSFPFIESTFQAVSGLFMLEEMERACP